MLQGMENGLEDHRGVGADLPHGLGARRHESGDLLPAVVRGAVLPAHGSVGLVAYLHHADIHPRLHESGEGVLGVLVEGFRLLVDIQPRPGLGIHLLGGVRPEIGVVEVDQQFHTVYCRLTVSPAV